MIGHNNGTDCQLCSDCHNNGTDCHLCSDCHNNGTDCQLCSKRVSKPWALKVPGAGTQEVVATILRTHCLRDARRVELDLGDSELLSSSAEHSRKTGGNQCHYYDHQNTAGNQCHQYDHQNTRGNQCHYFDHQNTGGNQCHYTAF